MTLNMAISKKKHSGFSHLDIRNITTPSTGDTKIDLAHRCALPHI
jgi:hypothetical protein